MLLVATDVSIICVEVIFKDIVRSVRQFVFKVLAHGVNIVQSMSAVV